MSLETSLAEDFLCNHLATNGRLTLQSVLSGINDNDLKKKAVLITRNQAYLWFNQAAILLDYFHTNAKINSSDFSHLNSPLVLKLIRETSDLGKRSLIQAVGSLVGKDRRECSWPAVILANLVNEGFDLSWDQRLIAGFSFDGLSNFTTRESAVLLLIRHLSSTPGLRLDPKEIINLFAHLLPPSLRWSSIDTLEKVFLFKISEPRIQFIPGLNTPRITRIGIAIDSPNGSMEWVPPTIALPDLGDWKTISRTQSTASELRCFPGWSSFDRMIALETAREYWQAANDSNHESEIHVLTKQTDSSVPQTTALPPDSKVLKCLQKSPLAENSACSQPISGTNSTKPLRELINSIDASKAWFFLGYDDSIAAIENGILANADPNTFGSAAQILLNRILLLGRWEILSPKESEILESMVSRIRYQGINLKVCLTPDEINLANDYQFLPADITISDIQSYHPKAQAGLPYLHEVGLVIGTVAPSSSNIRLSAGVPSQRFSELHTHLRQSGLHGTQALNILNNWPQAKRSLQDRDYQAVRLTKAIFSNDAWRDRNTINFEATSKALDQFLNQECSIRLEFPKPIRINPENTQTYKVINRSSARNYNITKVKIPGLLGPKGPISPAEVEVD